MTTPAAVPVAGPRLVGATAAPAPALAVPIARRVIALAALLGIAADALLRTSIVGVALPIYVALLALALAALAMRADRGLTRESAGWLGTALLFAAMVAWRDAEMLQVAGVFTTLGALLMAAVTLRDSAAGLFARRLRDTLWGAFTTGLAIAVGMIPLALRDAVATGPADDTGRRAAPVLRAIAIAAVLLLVFGSLLRGADPIFASLVALPDLDVGTIVSHVFLIGLFTWLAGGWTRAALDERAPSHVPTTPALTLGALEITTALVALTVLFAAYVLAQLGWFFGGEQFLRERTGLTAAEYARRGFFQMVWVVLLVVPLLLATRALLADDARLARRHTLLSLPLLVLLGAMIVSAMARLRLYVHYYGLTTDRLYPMVFMAWLAIVLVWLALTVLRGRGERFVAGALGSGLVILAALNVASPDRVVARVNVARAETLGAGQRPLDLRYLASLGGEAVPIAVASVLAPPRGDAGKVARNEWDGQRCDAAWSLLNSWGPVSGRAEARRQDAAWRGWNAGDVSALRVVGENAARLRTVQHEACRAAGTRGGRTLTED